MLKVVESKLFREIGGRQHVLKNAEDREEQRQEAERGASGGAEHVKAEDAQRCKCNDGKHDLADEILYFVTHFENSFYNYLNWFLFVRELTFSF